MCGLHYKESWVLKNWCFWTVVLEKTLESPLDYQGERDEIKRSHQDIKRSPCKEIQPVNPKGNQSWIFIGRSDTEADAPIIWPPDVKNWLTGKDPDSGEDWRQEDKGTIKDEIVRWHHRLDGQEFEQASGVGDGQGSLACCSPWGLRETWLSDWTTANGLSIFLLKFLN